MAKDFSDLWAPASRKERTRIKEDLDKFYAGIDEKLEDAPPSFDNAKYTLSLIENGDDRRAKLEEIIAKYEIALVDIERAKDTYEQEHSNRFMSMALDEDRHRVEGAIKQIRMELEYFQTRLKHNNLDFTPLKKRTDLKKLYYPFDKNGAASYTGISVSTIEKHPKEWGADMSSVPYGYTPETLDRILIEKKLVSPYWGYPELVVPVPNRLDVTAVEEGTSGLRKIFWRGENPDREILRLIEFWEDQDYIDIDISYGDYINQRFTLTPDDKTKGDTIIWTGAQPDLVAYLELLISEKFLPKLSQPNQYIREHFVWRGRDGNIRDWNDDSLNAERSKIRKYLAKNKDHNISSKALLQRLVRIENEIVELKLI